MNAALETKGIMGQILTSLSTVFTFKKKCTIAKARSCGYSI